MRNSGTMAVGKADADFGGIPDEEYFEEDLRGLQTYYVYRKEKGLDAFYLDDITWRDLSMEAVFQRMNATLCSSGEQYLYYRLRTPMLQQAPHQRQRDLVRRFGEDVGLRRDTQAILRKLGKRRAANTRMTFAQEGASKGLLAAPIMLCALLMLSLLGMFMLPWLRAVFFGMVAVNIAYHALMMRRMEREMATLNYTVGMVTACRRMAKQCPTLGPLFPGFFEAGRRTAPIARTGGISIASAGDLMTLVSALFLVDLIAFERLKTMVERHRDDLHLIHETLGCIDASIAVASFRASVDAWCEPQVEFASETRAFLNADGIRHPLLKAAVPNDLHLERSLLLTGANASGKSTFIKAVAVNMILAQTVATATADRFDAAACRVYTSMALHDSMQDGDSYFMVEIKSIKRIVDAAKRGERVFCAIDEVLRGTNTVERIAASSALLRALDGMHVLALAATHDRELCTLLPDFRMAHFAERIDEGSVRFDYRLREGASNAENAIKLLGVLGFDPAIVTDAKRSAERYRREGRWKA